MEKWRWGKVTPKQMESMEKIRDTADILRSSVDTHVRSLIMSSLRDQILKHGHEMTKGHYCHIQYSSRLMCCSNFTIIIYKAKKIKR